MSDLRAKLESEILPTEWAMLAMHHRRGALFVIDPSLVLLDVATAIAEDRTNEVEAWISAAKIVRPVPDQVAGWEVEEGARFRSVIVQPYVLAQRID